MKWKCNVMLFLCILFSVVSAEKVSTFRYTGYPEYLNGRTIKRDADIVALAERLTAFDSSSSFTSGGGATSVMLVIDHSTSMLLNLVGNSNPLPKDPDGVRFAVTSKLIDEIQKKSPETEIGLSIFSSYLYLDPNDDPLIEELDTYKKYSGIQGGFLPLMALNKEVNIGNNSGMTGAEVLKKYLETRDTTVVYKGGTNNYKKLAYEPTNGLLDPLRVKEEFDKSSGTNIWAGFAAAKEAMLKSKVDKKNQFIVFLSDGDHSHVPSGAGPSGFGWEEIVAENCPTSFCVYFDVKGVAWPMENLLEDIQNNGYSSSNPLSSFKKMSAGEDEVMQYMKESVISKIVTNTTYVTPKEITMNGITTTNWIKDKDWFEFEDIFGLKKNGDTEFDISLRYSRKVIDANTGNETPLTDTTISIQFSVSESSGESINDSLDTRYWGRTLALFNGSTEIINSDIIDETMTDLTVTFEGYEVDTTYDYTTVPVTITTVNGNDEEVVTLTKSGSHWEYTIAREEGAESQGDGTLQHQNPDTLVFTFHNPDLPLDTLQIKRYYYQESSAITLKNASLHDVDANGTADSITIEFVGKDAESVKDEIVNALILPNDRDFTITKSEINGSELSLLVTENSGKIKTITDSIDTLVVENEIALNDKLFLNPCRLVLIDKMAPIVMSASVLDSAEESSRDELTVTFSEDILESSIGDNPFELYSIQDSKTFEASLSILAFNGDEVRFEILSLDGMDRIVQGDSIRIDASVNSIIADVKNNKQENDKNIRREINVEIIDKTMSLGDAVYFDTNADGFVDSISLDIRGGDLHGGDVDALVKVIKLPDHRDLKVEKSSFVSGLLAITVSENSGVIRTATDSQDALILRDTFFLDGSDAFIVPSTVSIEDKMAPVVMSASVVDSVKSGAMDILTLTVSEELSSFSTAEPFSFYTGTTAYSVTLSEISNSGTEFQFEILSVSGQDKILNGDSLHFNAGEAIEDIKGNGQSNSGNIKREINCTLIEEGIKITQALYFDTNADGLVDSILCPIYGKPDLIEKHIDTIVKTLEFNDERDFSIDSYFYAKKAVSLLVTENSGVVNTAVDENDKILLEKKITIEEDSTEILPFEVICEDKMAPVILTASVVDSQIVILFGEKDSLYTNANGELTVRFSEKVDDHSMDEPFNFYHEGNSYETLIEPIEFNGAEVIYQILSIDPREKVTTGDSINIVATKSSDLMDLNEIKQLNVKNIRREIAVETFFDTIRVPAPYELQFKSTVLSRGYGVEGEFRGDDSLQEQMVIIIEPDTKENFCDADSLVASLVIFDPVGNEVTEELPLNFDRDAKRLILFWDGKNLQERNVGRGSCAVVAKVTRFFEGEVKEQQVINALVGIREKM